MAFQKPQGSQVDIQSIASEIAADPGATATFDGEYLRLDGTNSMSGSLNLSSNAIIGLTTINGQNNLDVSDIGVSVEPFNANIQTHIANVNVHFTEASINHNNITNIGVNAHTTIDIHIADATVHFTEASINHNNIVGVGTNTHTVIDTHIANMLIHRQINDSGSTTTDLWSANKIGTELALKANLAGGTFTGPVVFGGIPQLPSFVLSSLPTGVIGGLIYVSDANSGAGAIAFYNGINWIDPSTGLTVV